MSWKPGSYRRRVAALAAKRRPKSGGSVFDLYRLEKAAELRASMPTVIVVDADAEMLEASARAIAKLMGDDFDAG
jgi:hypothetical protein